MKATVAEACAIFCLLLTVTAHAADMTASKTDDVQSGSVNVSVPHIYLGSPTLFNMDFSISIPSMAPVKDMRHNDFKDQRTPRDDDTSTTPERVMVVGICPYVHVPEENEGCSANILNRYILIALDSEKWPNSNYPDYRNVTDPKVIDLTTGNQPLIRVFDHSKLPKNSEEVFGRTDCSDSVCQVQYFYSCAPGPPYPPFRICHGPFQDKRTGVRGSFEFIRVDPEAAKEAIEKTIGLLRSWTHVRG